ERRKNGAAGSRRRLRPGLHGPAGGRRPRGARSAHGSPLPSAVPHLPLLPARPRRGAGRGAGELREGVPERRAMGRAVRRWALAHPHRGQHVDRPLSPHPAPPRDVLSARRHGPRRDAGGGGAVAGAARGRAGGGNAHPGRPRRPARATARGLRAPALRGDEPGGDLGEPGAEPGHGEEHAAPRGAPPARSALGAARMIEHLLARRRLSLLAWGALDVAERARTERHVAECRRCARELATLRSLYAELSAEAEPLRAAEPPVPVEFVLARVRARLDEPASAPRAVLARRLATLGAAVAAAAAFALVFPRLVQSPSPPAARA